MYETVTEQLKAQIDAQTEEMLGDIENNVTTKYTLADAIREGASVTRQAYNWGDGQETACALSAAAISARARGLL